MSETSLELFLIWITQHPVWFNILIFLVAFTESLVVIGLIVPGFLLMIGFGALIATGHVDFSTTVLLAVAGAIAGDGLSYWLGKHYQQRLTQIWPLSRYPHLIKQGEQFFARHGGKSVILGRFFGPLRAIVPTIAGISNMPLQSFLLSNVLSALVWAPLYLLPGILFGMSIQLAREFAGQIAVSLVILFILIFVLISVIRTTYNWFIPRVNVLSYRLLIWSRKHPFAGKIPNGIINPEHSEVRALTSLAILLLFSLAGFFALSEFLLHTPLLENLDKLIFFVSQKFYSPPMTAFFSSLIAITNIKIILVSFLLVASSYLAAGNYQASLHLLAALVFPILVISILGMLFNFKLPPDQGSINHIFTAGNYAITVSVYGFITILICQHFKAIGSIIIYIMASMLILFTGIAQLYFAQHWFSDFLASLLLSVFWITVLGIAYHRHLHKKTASPAMLKTGTTSLLAIFLLGTMLLSTNTLPLPQQSDQKFVMGYKAWQETGWGVLPDFRNDIQASQQYPFNLQWAASEKNISKILTQNHWQIPDNDVKKYLNWLNNQADVSALPIVDHVNNGQYNSLIWIKPVDNQQVMVLRLWTTPYLLKANNKKDRLWLGNISISEKVSRFNLNYLVTRMNFDSALQRFSHELSRMQASYRVINRKTRPPNRQDKKLLLISS